MGCLELHLQRGICTVLQHQVRRHVVHFVPLLSQLALKRLFTRLSMLLSFEKDLLAVRDTILQVEDTIHQLLALLGKLIAVGRFLGKLLHETVSVCVDRRQLRLDLFILLYQGRVALVQVDVARFSLSMLFFDLLKPLLDSFILFSQHKQLLMVSC